MTAFHEFLLQRLEAGGFPTEDALASFLPLARETLEAHGENCVAPLAGLDALHVDGSRIWFEQARRLPFRRNPAAVHRVQAQVLAGVEVVEEIKRTSEVDDAGETIVNLLIAERGQPVERPVYLPGYVAWEQEVEHHDPLTDIFSLGMILASLACGLDFTQPEDLERFVASRDNLFRIAPDLHPVLARAITRMTEVDRHRRAQDLEPLIKTLENYRDQVVDFDMDLARIQGLRRQDTPTKRHVVLTKLRERLFELSRRNRLLHFRATMQSVNLTQASVPLSLDIRNIRPDQILIWNDTLQQTLAQGKPISLSKYLNFAEAIYLPSVLDRIIAEARRDQAEYGFAQLRLVVCFLHWANLKEKPVERFDSPLILVPVRLTKKKGIRDTYRLEAVESEAEVNPVVRHQFKQLYDIDLPDRIDLARSSLDDFFAYLAKRIESSDVSVTLKRIDRPRISLIHERARRRLDQYRRRARLAGRGVRKYLDLDYSYDPANYHPLGIKLFAAKVRTPATQLRSIVEEKPRPRTYMVPPAETPEAVKERSFFHLRDGGEDNPFTWTFDQCSVTLANFKYRKMSLVRDYDGLLDEQAENGAFDSIFSLAPRSAERRIPQTPPLDERFDVVPCDPTQAAAIEESRTGSNYIIQGPPGTGKSQTITNLIADYVARGKRVLFVCEKRAAIDVVFARLRQCGLKDLCTLIHDSQADKKPFVMDLKETYERMLETAARKPERRRRVKVLEDIRAQLEPLERFDRTMTEPHETAGMSLRALLDRCFAFGAAPRELSPLELERLPDFSDCHRHADAISRYGAALSVVQPDGVAARHPLSVLAPWLADVEQPLALVASAAENALEKLQELKHTLSSSHVPAELWNDLARCRLLIEYALRVRPVTAPGLAALLDDRSEPSRRLRAGLDELERQQRAAEDAAAKNSAWRTRLPEAEVAAALEQVSRLEGMRYFAFLSPTWWRLRGILNRCYDFRSHVVRPSWRQVLEGLRDEYARHAEVRQGDEQLARQFGLASTAREFAKELDALRLQALELPDWLRGLHDSLPDSDDARRTVERLVAADPPLRDLRSQLERFTDDAHELPLADLAEVLAGVRASLDELPDFLRALRELADVPERLARALRTIPLSPRQLQAAAARRTLEDCYRQEADVERFTGETRTRHALQLQRLYGGWLEANAHEIRRSVERRFLRKLHVCGQSATQLTAEEKEFKKRYNRGRRELEHEFGKSMRYKPIRELVSGESGEVVQDLKPVWLMSPLSVSDTLPLDARHFDVVIFDEASQLTLEEAMPSVFRAAQSIVVGDEMQLPPTDFFSTKRDQQDDEDLVVEEEGELVEYDLESDSFLNHAARNLPSTMLGWHYRSRSESLISFSNWKFYDGRLLTVPEERIADLPRPPIVARDASDAERGAQCLLERAISFHYLEHGVYENRRNRSEAEYVAEMVRQLLRDESRRTIGVVAFSEAQQGEIQDALGRLADEDRDFANRLEAEYEREDDGQFVGLLVKNLENIQGDERDVILLSVCYGKDPAGKMRMNFGPINKSGGEKRLNVAFSRAKHHMALVSSIKHTEITNDYNDGANCLKQYLRYAEAVSASDAPTVTSVLQGIARWQDSPAAQAPRREALAERIGEALAEHGFLVDHHVGQSHFRCDLAVRRRDDVAYRLGIQLDTGDHYEQPDVLERDVMRPALLRGFGWRLTHVLAKDWYADPQAETQRLLNLLDGQDDPWLAGRADPLPQA